MSARSERPGTAGAGWANALSERLGRALAAAVALLLAVLVVLAAAETAAWVLAELSWPQLAEIQALLLVWLTFLSAAWGIHGRVHLAVELLARWLPSGARQWVDRLATALTATFGGLCAWYGGRLATSVLNTLPATGLSAAWQYAPAAFGGLLIAVLALLRLAASPRTVDRSR